VAAIVPSKAPTRAEKHAFVPAQTPRTYIDRDRVDAHEKEQRRASAAISPTTLLSGSAFKKPSGVAEFVRMIYFKLISLWWTAVAQWLRRCATNRKVAGYIPDGVTVIFH